MSNKRQDIYRGHKEKGVSMTIKEFYQWVEENNIEDYELCYNGDAGGGSVKAVLSDIEINDKFKEVTIG